MACRVATVLLSLAPVVAAQGPPPNGPRTVEPGHFALVGGTVVTAPDAPPAVTTVVLRDGHITALGGTPPAGATVVDCTGQWLYPGLVEPFLPIDVPALDPTTGDRHWNPMIQAGRRALEGAGVAAADREALWQLGYTAAAITPSGGILKGTAAVVLLEPGSETLAPRVVRDRAFAVASLQPNRGGYPNSEMGAIALLRQTLLDGRWYRRAAATVSRFPELAPRSPQPSSTLQALADQDDLPLWCDSVDELQGLRLLRIAAESGRPAVLVGCGFEFRRLDALAATKTPIVVPLAMPEVPEVRTAAAAEAVSLRHLQSWEQAPTNSRRLLDAGVTIAWTTHRLTDRKEFAERRREAVAGGITEAAALAAMTTVPARLLGVDNRLGTIAVGKLANLTVTSGPLFAPRTVVHDVWVGGRRHPVTPAADRGLDGAWSLDGLPDAEGTAALRIRGEQVTAQRGETKLSLAGVQRSADRVTFQVGDWAVSLYRVGEELRGTAHPFDGSAPRALQAKAAPAPADDAPPPPPSAPPAALAPLPTPLGGYGRLTPATAGTFAIVGADLWTADTAGIVRDGAVLVRDGKLTFVGARKDLPALPPGTPVLDAAGKHLTPGIIDCHSHTGIARGINESGQAVTAEVRVADVLDPDDINWYRQLAGGVTTVNQLHGSANAIGGQSCTTKVRWGVANPDDMHFAKARPGIKFALGENPRGANSREESGRYPNTRMGVEALLRDRFAAATAYAREQASHAALDPQTQAATLPPRRDLELEALAEVLAGSRWIHCHSYRQDEISMLCTLAGEYGIRIGTFQHVLEGYKVADAIAAHAVGASSFSDWWAYKFEVYDAIPDNGAILHEQGVVVSFNSDSDEHARRLNTEAGKAVKYGGVAPHAALCFVTSNPARQLDVFDRTGSLAVGKDADLALWSGDPLSYQSRCEATWVDGCQLFSLADDAALRAAIAAERTRLIRLAAAKAAGKGKGEPKGDRAKDDAYWAAEDQTLDYCCRDCEGARR